MMKQKIIGQALPNIPWEDKSADCTEVIWRYSDNPIIEWNPILKAARTKERITEIQQELEAIRGTTSLQG